MANLSKTAPLVLVLLIFATCSPDFASGIPCTNDLECPTGYTCLDQKCVSAGGSSNPGGGGDGDGSGSGTGFSVEPSALEFGGVQVKDQQVMTVKVKNIAKANAAIQVKAEVTTGGDVFKSLTQDYVTVKPKSENGSVDVQIAYTPVKIAADTGKVDIMSNEPGNPRISVTLKGNGIDPDLEVVPGTIDFGTVFKGATVPTAKVTVKNNGQGTLVIESINIGQNPNNQYSMANVPAMKKNLDTNSSFSFDVQFKPSIPGDTPGSIVIKAEDRDKAEATITLKGSIMADCKPGYFDLNADSNDGCECKQDKSGGATCTNPTDLGPIADTATVVKKEGNLVPEKDADWYTFMATDEVGTDISALCDAFHVRAIFTKNPDILAMDVYQGCGADKREVCASACDDPVSGVNAEWARTNRLCEASQDKFAFALDFNEPDPVDPVAPPKGQCPCTQESATTGELGKNFCLDDSQRFYVRVYRIPGSKLSCEKYEIEISNGYYKYTDP